MTIDTRHLRHLIARACPLPWMIATSNSWRRIVDATHTWVCTPCTQPDGHPDLQFAGGYEGANAQLLIEAVNSLPVVLDALDDQAEQLAAYPADWRKDSSLETWFPYTADQLKVWAAEIVRLTNTLRCEAEWHEAEAKASRALQKSKMGVYHGLKAEWHQEHAQKLRAVLSGESHG